MAYMMIVPAVTDNLGKWSCTKLHICSRESKVDSDDKNRLCVICVHNYCSEYVGKAAHTPSEHHPLTRRSHTSKSSQQIHTRGSQDTCLLRTRPLCPGSARV